MQRYKSIYLDAMGYSVDEPEQFVSELSGRSDGILEIHHLKFLSKTTDRQKYKHEHLIMLTRAEHAFYGEAKHWYDYLTWMHIINMEARRVRFNFHNFPEHIVPNDFNEQLRFGIFWGRIFLDNKSVLFREIPSGILMEVYKSFHLVFSIEAETKEELILSGL